jgi:hypothetical protein
MGEATDADGRLSETAQVWNLGLSKLSLDEIAAGVNALVESGDNWPPTLTEFREVCKPSRPSPTAYHAAAERRYQQQRRAVLPKPGQTVTRAAALDALRGIRAALGATSAATATDASAETGAAGSGDERAR